MAYNIQYNKHKHMLRHWIDETKLYNGALSGNPKAVSYLEKHPERIVWRKLSKNPNAIPLLKKNPEKIAWEWLSCNPSPDAIPLLEENPEKIDWHFLSKNPTAIPIIEKNLDKVKWEMLCTNPNAIPLLKKHPEKVVISYLCGNPNPDVIPFLHKFEKIMKKMDSTWWGLSKNPHAVNLLKANPERINWNSLSANPNPDVIPLLEQNPEKINWIELTKNPGAIPFLKKNMDKIKWTWISGNPNPQAMDIIESVINKPLKELKQKNIQQKVKLGKSINMYYLSKNPHAIYLLEKHPEKICWESISLNPNIFITYEEIAKQIAPYREELLRTALHPKRVARIMEMAGDNACLEDIL